ncbi:hypothetical protein FHG87_010715 [Trinorchestia longiramus]|nr:hypothetical protein FHG87_010715 [Trinorchestia longiramus]
MRDIGLHLEVIVSWKTSSIKLNKNNEMRRRERKKDIEGEGKSEKEREKKQGEKKKEERERAKDRAREEKTVFKGRNERMLWMEGGEEKRNSSKLHIT